MSLESAIQENTTAMRELIAALMSSRAIAADAVARAAADAIQVREPAAEKEPAAELAAKTAGAAAPTPPPAAADSSQAKPVTYDDVKTAVLELIKKKGRDAAADVLSRFGVQKAPDLREEHYSEAVEMCKRVIEGGAA